MLFRSFVGFDIDAVVNEIAEIMYTQRSRVLPDDLTITRRFQRVVPFSRSNPEDVAAIQQWGRTRAVPAGRAERTDPGVGSTTSRRVVMRDL